jgi:SAM-dependent methyltransferase
MTSALATYGAALRSAAGGTAVVLRLVDPAGRHSDLHLSPRDWCALRPGDGAVLARCHGPTLDVGCGPGRFAAALRVASVPALGIDICLEAVRLARSRGAAARQACVLSAQVPGRWRHILLIDGNIGIGGDPRRLLRRCRALLAPRGDLLVELDPPGSGSWSGAVSLDYRGRRSTPFAWAGVCLDDLSAVAESAALTVIEQWTEAGRWFARLAAT